MASTVTRRKLRGRARNRGMTRVARDRVTQAMRLLHLIRCYHRHAYVAGSLRICEECDTIWRLGS